MPQELEQDVGHLLRGQDMVDRSVSDRAARHAIVLGGHGILRDGQPSSRLDRSQAERAVGSGSGEDDPDPPLLRVRRQGAQEEVDRHADAAGLDGLGQPQRPSADAQVSAGRHAIDVIGLDRRVGFHLHHGHGGAPAEQLRDQARVRRVQVLHEHEGHAAVGGGMAAEEPPEGVETSCRGTQSHDRGGHLARGCLRARRRTPSTGSAGARSASRCHRLPRRPLLRAAPRSCRRTHPRTLEKREPSHRCHTLPVQTLELPSVTFISITPLPRWHGYRSAGEAARGQARGLETTPAASPAVCRAARPAAAQGSPSHRRGFGGTTPVGEPAPALGSESARRTTRAVARAYAVAQGLVSCWWELDDDNEGHSGGADSSGALRGHLGLLVPGGELARKSGRQWAEVSGPLRARLLER